MVGKKNGRGGEEREGVGRGGEEFSHKASGEFPLDLCPVLLFYLFIFKNNFSINSVGSALTQLGYCQVFQCICFQKSKLELRGEKSFLGHEGIKFDLQNLHPRRAYFFYFLKIEAKKKIVQRLGVQSIYYSTVSTTPVKQKQ